MRESQLGAGAIQRQSETLYECDNVSERRNGIVESSRKWTPERINELALEIAKEVDEVRWIRIKYKIEGVLRKYL